MESYVPDEEILPDGYGLTNSAALVPSFTDMHCRYLDNNPNGIN